ncbi:MAG TPA: DUF5916 domain-containing protein [Thermoanaerobaculia bacterium]|nr:DUF5916 domain-containing protein [Thermoanaerobaculia bacterium]HUM31232.1 DUF5916 domain-containing protein [Thermoanaerobaculia bacterium]HXK69586.1 DUF5916 domain-containing protein [Thermoanaerobaculia bacterium]
MDQRFLIRVGTSRGWCNPRSVTRGILMLFLMIVCVTSVAQEAEKMITAEVQSIRPTSGPIVLDGILDEPGWVNAWNIEVPIELTPGENIPAPVRTTVWLTHDESNLYAAFKAYDPNPEEIRAHLSDRDNAWSDDWVGIVLDTFNDQRRDYLFVVNPLGIQMDSIEVWNGGSGGSWDGIWDAVCKIESWGWTAEMKIPFSTLRFQRVPGEQIWGFDAVRGYTRSFHRQMGAFPRDRNNNCYLCQAIKIKGFAGLTPGLNLEVNPTLTAVATDSRPDFPGGSMERDREDVEAGLTVKWGFTTNLTLSSTLNPDFSQVEADSLQLDVNEPFALYYEEKRPFFMEGADIFSNQFNTVYTRTVREPSWGLKLTGKEKSHTLGAYLVQDDTTNVILPGSQGSSWLTLDTDSMSTVVRYAKDFGDSYTFGTHLTGRKGDGYQNSVLGLDGNLRFTDRDWFKILVVGSSTEYPDRVVEDYDQPSGSFSDFAGWFYFRHSSRNFVWVAEYVDVGEDFRADMGYMPQVDYRQIRGAAEYSWIPVGETWFTGLSVEAGGWKREDQQGEVLQDNGYITANYTGPLQSHVMLEYDRTREGYGQEIYNLNRYYIHNCMSPNGDFHYWINFWWGDRIDYVNHRPGNRFRTNVGLQHKPGRHLEYWFDLTYEKMSVPEGRLYTARIGQVTMTYQFTPRTFLRLILQGVDHQYETDLYIDDREPESKNLFTQMLYSYKLNPRTVLFLGYSDTRLGDQDIDLTQLNRTVFLKIGYAWTR